MISIIVPYYFGRKYIPQIVRMYNKNQKKLREIYPDEEIELLIVNDSPSELIEVQEAGVRIVVNKKNMGIHASRVAGLESSRGEYVLFLDQDDIITDQYMVSQMRHMKENTVVVCNGIHRGMPIYKSESQFKHIIDECQYCPMISPGQSLLRKKEIPQEWKKNILQNSGADDFFLWILLRDNGISFQYNEEILYEHINHKKNKSSDLSGMIDSLEELKDILCVTREQSDIVRSYCSGINSSVDTYTRRIALQERFNNMFSSDGTIQEILEKNKCSEIVIYGFGTVGQAVYEFLLERNSKVAMILDLRAELYNRKVDCPLLKPDEKVLKKIEKNQLVIVTVMKDNKIIVDWLLHNGVKSVMSIDEFGKRK